MMVDGNKDLIERTRGWLRYIDDIGEEYELVGELADALAADPPEDVVEAMARAVAAVEDECEW